LGVVAFFALFSIRFRWFHFIARPAKWMASDEPIVDVPTLVLWTGALNSRARMFTQRDWISVV
jgi:hypothetical protein